MNRVTYLFISLCATLIGQYGYAATKQTVNVASAVITPDLSKVMFGLLAVLVMIVVFGFMLKKINQISVKGSKSIKVLTGLSLGMREKVVLLQVDGKQLLVGVAPGTIQTLYVFDANVEASSHVASEHQIDTKFGALLGRMVKTENGS